MVDLQDRGRRGLQTGTRWAQGQVLKPELISLKDITVRHTNETTLLCLLSFRPRLVVMKETEQTTNAEHSTMQETRS